MKDEYGAMNANGLKWRLSKFELENGFELLDVNVVYQTFGNLNENCDNAIFVCHALTGNSALNEWWSGLFGYGKAFNPQRNFIICSNILGSCYGTTGPSTICRRTGKQYGTTFPEITVRDSVRLQIKLVKEVLGVRQVEAVIGGMHTLEWALLGHYFVRSIIPLSCNGQQSAWQIGISHLKRNAIYLDPNFRDGNYYGYDPPYQGLSLARQMAMVSYRSYTTYNTKFHRNVSPTDSMFDVESYLTYQGTKFIDRFDTNSFITLMEMSDNHDVGRERGGVENALAQIFQPTLIIGIDSDLLYPLSEQKALEQYIPNSKLKVVCSPHGHDGFLLEQKEISESIVHFLNNLE